MGFLREQMGEEELRHLLEMLSVEAGEPGGHVRLAASSPCTVISCAVVCTRAFQVLPI